MKKMVLRPVLAGLVCLVFLAECSGRSGGSGSRQDMENFNPTGLPIVKEMESFSLLVDDEDDPNKKLLPLFEKDTNVRVDVMAYPNNAAVERKNILLASGDYPAVISGWLLGQHDIIRLRDDHVIIPLTDLIENYTVNIKEALELPGVREAMTHPDGEIYTIPYVVDDPLTKFNPWINTVWLNRLGLPMPTTTEEFKNTLIAFRDGIPPVNGQRIIPFSASPYTFRPGVLAGWFGVNASDIFAMIDGRLEITIDRPEYREFIKYFADLYANGLIDPELFTQDQMTWISKGRMGLYGVSYAYTPADFASTITDDITVNQYAYEALPVLRAPGVEKPVYIRASYGYTVFRTQAIITDNAKNPLTIIRWFDYLFDQTNSLEMFWGPVGIRFEQLADGTYRETANGRNQEVINQVTPTFFWAMPKFVRPGTKVKPPEGQLPPYNSDDMRDVLYEPYLDEMIPQSWPETRISQQITQLTQAIGYYHSQKVAAWISGQANVDAEWDAYLANLKQLGIDELLSLQRGLIGK